MKESTRFKDGDSIYLVEFDSTGELVKYLKSNPRVSYWFEGHEQSQDTSYSMYEWCKSSSFDEALNLLENGWAEEAKKIEGSFKLMKGMKLDTKYVKFVQDVVGFQPIVANYLMGIPQSMVGSKMVPKKQKVVTLNMTASFNSAKSARYIEENCLNVLRVVRAIEASGCRVNLNVFYSGWVNNYWTNSRRFGLIKVKVKSANERLNISKVAFPIVHPSFLRRIMLRVVETNRNFSSEFVGGYGKVVNDTTLVDIYGDMMKGQYLIPMHLREDEIKDANSVYAKLIRL